MFPDLYADNEDKDVIDFIKRNERSLRDSWKHKLKVLEGTLQVVAEGVKEANRQKLKPVELIWNLAGYVNAVAFDLAVTGELLMFERDQWKRRCFARMAAVNVYESSLDLPNMTGKEFRKEVLALPDSENFLELLGLKIKKIGKFKVSHQSWLKEIRLFCAAHRDQQLGNQLRVVFEISPTKVLRVMAEFDGLLVELGQVLQDGMKLLPKK